MRLLQFRSARVAAAAVACIAVLSAGCSQPPPGSVTSTSGVRSTGTAEVGAKWDWYRFDTWKPFLDALHGGITFYEVVWCDIEPQAGHADWSDTDSVIQRAHSIGFTPLVKIRVGRCWATGGAPQYLRGKKDKTESAMPQDLSRYAAFVKQVVTRYSRFGVTEYAVENEVNSPSFWAGTPQDYQRLVSVAAEAIRSADPAAQVVDSGMSSVASGYALADRLLQLGATQDAVNAYNVYFARRFGTRGQQIHEVSDEAGLREVLASAQSKRDIAFSDLTNRIVESHLVDVRQVHFYEQWSALPYLMTYMYANTPPSTPVEMWEVGAFLRNSTLTPAERKAELVKVVALALGAGVTKLVWLPLGDNPDGRVVTGQLYALLNPNGKPSPGAEALAAIDAACQGAKVVRIDGHGILGVGFDKAGHSTAFIWSNGASVTAVPVPAGTQIQGASGRRRILEASTEVSLGTSPQQIILPSTTEQFVAGLS